MATPSPRTPVRPARGPYAVLLNDFADLAEGELVFINDQNTLYVKEGVTLVPITGQGSSATSGVQAGDNISKLVNDVGYITLDEVPADRVQSVNGHIGIVVLDADDIPDTATVNKFTTEEEINKLAGIETGAQVNEVNEAPINGTAYLRQDGAWVSAVLANGGVLDGGNFDTGAAAGDGSASLDGGVFT